MSLEDDSRIFHSNGKGATAFQRQDNSYIPDELQQGLMDMASSGAESADGEQPGAPPRAVHLRAVGATNRFVFKR